MGYDNVDKKLVINEIEAIVVRTLFDLYISLGSVRKLKTVIDEKGLVTKKRTTGERRSGGIPFCRGHLYHLLNNTIYTGMIAHKEKTYPGIHDAIIEQDVWDRAQALLSAQAPVRSAPTNIKQRCLLTSLVFDEHGEPLSPSYTKKKGRRYHYYISKNL